MKRKIFAILLAAVMTITVIPCLAAAEEATATVRKVIIDTDTGTDDASALILAAKTPGIEILGVTVLAGT